MYALSVSTLLPSRAPAEVGAREDTPSAPRDAADDDRTIDARIVGAIREGSRRAEEELYRRHAPSLLRLATRLLRSTEDARDVVQDTWVTALSDLGSLRDAGAARAWLHTVCVRLVHRRFRRRKLLALFGLDRTEEDAKLEQLASPELGPDERAELRAVDRALDALPAEEKIAWVLRHVEGLALEEIAGAAGCSLATVKRRIAAADATVTRLREGGR